MKDWEESYKNIGEIQTKVCDIVKEGTQLFKKNKAKKVIDVCFGTGRHTIFLAEQGYEVYGIDISEKGMKITEQKLNEKNLEAHLQIADMKKLPYDDGFFDSIVAVHCIMHNTLDGLKQTISELDRVLKPGGFIVVTLISRKDPRFGRGKKVEDNTYIDTSDPNESDVPHHYSDEEELRELFSNFNMLRLEENSGFSKRRKEIAVHLEFIVEKK